MTTDTFPRSDEATMKAGGVQRGLILFLIFGLLLAGSGTAANGSNADPFHETRFWTGCDPGPYQPPPAPEHLQGTLTAPTYSRSAQFHIDLDSATRHPPILGTGFNFEHAVWSCPEFRGLFKTEIL